METHAKAVGILNILFGAVGLCGALVLIVVFGGVVGLIGAEGDPDAAIAMPIVGITGAAIVLITVLMSLPAIIIGYGLFKLRPWSRLAGIVLSIVSLIAFPFGTVIGIYGLWVLFSPDGQRLFETAQASHA